MPTWSVKALAFLKQYWLLFAVAGLLVVGYSVFKQQQANVAATVEKLNQAHQAEIDQINQARATEQAQKQQELQQLQDSLAKIQQGYAAQQQQVVVEQRVEATQIVKKYGNDPTALAQQLAQSMGFVVVQPADAGQ